jgi:hypothetical protein
MKEYLIPVQLFTKIKPTLNGWVFWRKEGNIIKLKTPYKSVQNHLLKFEKP